MDSATREGHHALMCGLYSLTTPHEALARLFGVQAVPTYTPRYKVAPGTDCPVVLLGRDGQRRIELLRWGFRPSWADKRRAQINARGETVFTSTMFREAARRHRCAVPMDGFFEPQGPKRSGRPQYHFRYHDGRVFAVPGIWTWFRSDAESYGSFALITTPAHAQVAEIHERSPALLETDDVARWIERGDRTLLAPRDESSLAAYRVTDALYRLDEADPACIAPAP